MVRAASLSVVRLAGHVQKLESLVLEIVLPPKNNVFLILIEAVEAHFSFCKFKKFLIRFFWWVEFIIVLISAFMKFQVNTLDLFLIRTPRQLYEPLHVGWVVQRLKRFEVVNTERDFESAISHVHLVRGVEGINRPGHGDDGILVVDQLLEALEGESPKH